MEENESSILCYNEKEFTKDSPAVQIAIDTLKKRKKLLYFDMNPETFNCFFQFFIEDNINNLPDNLRVVHSGNFIYNDADIEDELEYFVENFVPHCLFVNQAQDYFKTNEVDDQNRDIQALLDALLVFFLNLTIRMRLDRQDGIGEIVWADDIAIKGTLQGFLEGLALKSTTR